MSDLFFIRLNYSLVNIFVTSKEFRHFCPTKYFVQNSFLSHITYINAENLIWQNILSDKNCRRTKLFVGHNFRHFRPTFFVREGSLLVQKT